MEIDELEYIEEDCLDVKIIKQEQEEETQRTNVDLKTFFENLRGVDDKDSGDESDDHQDSVFAGGSCSGGSDDEQFKKEDGSEKDENSGDNDQSYDQSIAKKTRSYATKNFECSECAKTFSREFDCRRHMQKNHNIAVLDETKYSCTKCNKSFTTKSKLMRHENVHLPPEEKSVCPCPFCDKKFQKPSSVKMHIKVVHSAEKPYICEECGKPFKTIGALKEHKYTHTEDCPYQCAHCEKKFKNRARLKTHEDTHNDTTYVCTTCGLQLNTRRTLKMHMLVHSDQKKHKCNYCGNEFKRAKALKNHLILHTGLKPYTCNFCDKTFANGSNCRSHKKKTHPYELAALEAAGAKSCVQNMPKLEHLRAVASSQPLVDNAVRKLGKKELGPPEMKSNIMLPQQLEAIPTTISIDSSVHDPHSQSVIMETRPNHLELDHSNVHTNPPTPINHNIEQQIEQNYNVLAQHSIFQTFPIGS